MSSLRNKSLWTGVLLSLLLFGAALYTYFAWVVWPNQMKITFHWTGGKYAPSTLDLDSYHFVVDGSGKVWPGKYTVEDNIDTADGVYAPHTKLGNTRNIGIGIAAMKGYENPGQVGSFPMNEAQFEAACRLAAQLCQQYRIPISRRTVQTHWEWDQTLPPAEASDKPDITYLPFLPELSIDQPEEPAGRRIGDYVRGRTEWHFRQLNQATD